tara:strand:- start:1084 stop:3465 length:2382 start_codon:yes stop_codon:yes gene_type:complete
MPLTKIKRGGLDTGITDNSDANALTFDSSENATFVGNITSNTGKFYAPADVNLIGYSRNTKVIEYDANHTINMSYAANVAGDLTVQNTSGAGNLTLHGDPATLLVDGVGSAYSVIAKGAGGNWGALSFCVGTNDNSASTWWIGLDDDSGDDLHFANYQFGTSYLILDKSAGATFAGSVAVNGATIGSHKFVVDNGTSSLNRGNSAGDILDVRGQNASQMKVSTTAFTVTPSATFAGDVIVDNTSATHNLYLQGTNGYPNEIGTNHDNTRKAVLRTYETVTIDSKNCYTSDYFTQGHKSANYGSAIRFWTSSGDADATTALTLSHNNNATFTGGVSVAKDMTVKGTAWNDMFYLGDGTSSKQTVSFTSGSAAFGISTGNSSAKGVISAYHDGSVVHWGSDFAKNAFAGNVGINGGDPASTDQLEIASGGSATDVRVRFLEDGVSDSYILLDASEDWIGFSNNGTSRDMGIHTGSGDASFAADINMTGSQKKMKLHNSSNTVTSILRVSNRDTYPSSGNWADEYAVEIHTATSGTNSEVGMFLHHHENSSDRPILRAMNSDNTTQIEFGSNQQYKFRGELAIGDDIHTPVAPLMVKAPGIDGGGLGRFESTSSSSNPEGILVYYPSNSSTSGWAFYQANSAEGKSMIHNNGDFDSRTNSYGGWSDERIKTNIADANSQWDDIKNIRIRNFKYKSSVAEHGDDAQTFLGAVAQEVESISPSLVEEIIPSKYEIENCGFGEKNADGEWVVKKDENGKDMTVKTMKYSILYMKAVKCLQEAMEKIETLEAKVKVLENS